MNNKSRFFQLRESNRLPSSCFRTAYDLGSNVKTRLWRRSVLAPGSKGMSCTFSLPVSSSTFGNSRLRNGKGSCADHPRSQTDSRMSANVPSGLEKQTPSQIYLEINVQHCRCYINLKRILQSTRHDSYLFTLGDSTTGNDDDLVLFVKRHNFRNTVRCTGMIHIAGTVHGQTQVKYHKINK